jgi:fatty acid desaturase
MLEKLSLISSRLYRLKPFVALFGFLCFVLFLFSLLNLDYFNSDLLLIPSLLGGLWSALYFILLSFFILIPSRPDNEENFFKKIKIRLLRGIYYFFGAVFILLSLAVLILSIKLFSVWSAQ